LPPGLRDSCHPPRLRNARSKKSCTGTCMTFRRAMQAFRCFPPHHGARAPYAGSVLERLVQAKGSGGTPLVPGDRRSPLERCRESPPVVACGVATARVRGSRELPGRKTGSMARSAGCSERFLSALPYRRCTNSWAASNFLRRAEGVAGATNNCLPSHV